MRPFASLCLGATLSLAACSDLTSPAAFHPKLIVSSPASAAEAQPAAKPDQAPPAPAPSPPTNEEKFSASHVLIAYQGAMRSRATRTKDEALKLANKVIADAKAGKSFAELAKQYSDDPGSGAKGGDLGPLSASQVVKPFGDALKTLKPGEMSGVVESPFGFHVILRSP